VTYSRWWTLAACLVTAACGGNDAGGGSSAADGVQAGRPAESEPARGQSQAFSHGTVPMKLTGKVARYTYQAEGTGQCATSADASIYEVPATLWHAIFQDETAHVNFSVWRPKSGAPEMVNFSITDGTASHRIATVKGGGILGSGTPSVKSAGPGGTLTVTGRDDHGHEVELSVQCARFEELVAEGG